MQFNSEDEKFFNRSASSLMDIKGYNHQLHLHFFLTIQNIFHLSKQIEDNPFQVTSGSVDEVTHQCKLAELAHAITNTASLEQILYSSDFFNNFISVSKTHYMCLDYIAETNQLYVDLYVAIDEFVRDLLWLFKSKIILLSDGVTLNIDYLGLIIDTVGPYETNRMLVEVMRGFDHKLDKKKSSLVTYYFISNNEDSVIYHETLDNAIRKYIAHYSIYPVTITIRYMDVSHNRVINNYHDQMDLDDFSTVLEKELEDKLCTVSEYDVDDYRIEYYLGIEPPIGVEIILDKAIEDAKFITRSITKMSTLED